MRFDMRTPRYMSAGGRHPFTCEQAYLHEMLHALTGALDPEALHNLLNRGPIVYLTDKVPNEAGLLPVQYERKLTHEMVCIMTGASKIKAGEAFYNRGEALYFTDKILKEAGFSQPPQLVAALATSLDPESETRLLSYQTSARRSAAAEDRYMAQ